MVSACTGAVPPLKCLEYISALTQTPVCFFMAGPAQNCRWQLVKGGMNVPLQS